MKQIFSIILLIFIAGSGYSMRPTEPLNKEEIKAMSEAQRTERLQMLEMRLAEIKEAPLKELEKQERKALKKEVREIKKEMKMLQGVGIYISGSAILVILLLLLLL